jgi:hypothetical protein
VRFLGTVILERRKITLLSLIAKGEAHKTKLKGRKIMSRKNRITWYRLDKKSHKKHKQYVSAVATAKSSTGIVCVFPIVAEFSKSDVELNDRLVAEFEKACSEEGMSAFRAMGGEVNIVIDAYWGSEDDAWEHACAKAAHHD